MKKDMDSQEKQILVISAIATAIGLISIGVMVLVTIMAFI